jgi:hypothetical protein
MRVRRRQRRGRRAAYTCRCALRRRRGSARRAVRRRQTRIATPASPAAARPAATGSQPGRGVRRRQRRRFRDVPHHARWRAARRSARPNEQCDDGTTWTPTPPPTGRLPLAFSGDGVVGPGEVCDTTATDEPDACLPPDGPGGGAGSSGCSRRGREASLALLPFVRSRSCAPWTACRRGSESSPRGARERRTRARARAAGRQRCALSAPSVRPRRRRAGPSPHQPGSRGQAVPCRRGPGETQYGWESSSHIEPNSVTPGGTGERGDAWPQLWMH